MYTADPGGVDPVPTHSPFPSTKSTNPTVFCSSASVGDGLSPEPLCAGGKTVRFVVVSDNGNPCPARSNPQVRLRSCSSFCCASDVVDVAPFAMRLARVDSANSCATPSDTTVRSP